MPARILKIAAATCVLIALWQMFVLRKSAALAPVFEPPQLSSEPWPRSPGFTIVPIDQYPVIPSSATLPEPELTGPLLIASAASADPPPLNAPPPTTDEQPPAPPARLPAVEAQDQTSDVVSPPTATAATPIPANGELPPPAAENEAAPASPPPTESTRDANSDAAGAGSKAPVNGAAEGSAEKKEKLGEEPPSTAIDVFRQSAVLLPVGVLEWECGLSYTLFEDNFLTILPSSAIVPQRTSSRTFLASTSLRYGYNEVLQPYLTVPAGMSTVETANVLSDFSNDEYGMGDVSFGASYLLRDGHDECADVVFGLTCVAPTGKANFLSLVPGNASLGNGFWILSPSLTWTRTYDPVVVYATASYLHRFEREHFGVPIAPGEEFDLGYGAGFAINDNLTYSLQFQWAHQFDTRIDGQSIDDSGADIAAIRQGAIFRITPQRFLEAFFANGVTDNSPEISTGVLLVQRY